MQPSAALLGQNSAEVVRREGPACAFPSSNASLAFSCINPDMSGRPPLCGEWYMWRVMPTTQKYRIAESMQKIYFSRQMTHRCGHLDAQKVTRHDTHGELAAKLHKYRCSSQQGSRKHSGTCVGVRAPRKRNCGIVDKLK
jgi:hypothetical protein